MSKRIWTTREGEEIPYEDLEEGHLCSIVNMLERNAERAIGKLGSLGSLVAEDLYPDLVELRRELNKRLAKLEAKKIEEDKPISVQRFGLLELD
jgi:hypothetical protein